MGIFYKNRKNVLGFLSSFVNDPLLMKNKSSKTQISHEAELKKIHEKLHLIDSEKEITYSISEIVDYLICSATDDGHLKRMYFGWQSYI